MAAAHAGHAAGGAPTSLAALPAARASAVLEGALESLSFLSSLTPDVRIEDVSALVGDEISRIIAEQRALERRYDALVEERAQLKGLANKSKFKEVQAEIVALGDALRESVRALCRGLTDKPDIADNLARIAEERDAMQLLLDRTLAELRSGASGGGSYGGLSDFVRRETEQRERMAAVSTREGEAVAEVESLAATLKEEEEKHGAEAEMKRAEIGVLKEKLRKMKADAGLTLRYARKEAAARNEAAGRVNGVGEAAVAATVDALKAQLAAENAAHDASMGVLKGEQEEHTKAAEGWRAKTAAEVAAKTEQLAAATAARDAQRVQLYALQERYEADLQAMVDKQAEAKARTREIIEAAEADARRKAAATNLQKVLGEMFLTVKAVADAAAEAKKAAKAKAAKK
jgi:hypothetical protein